jgi:DNA-binding PadR family transcriptional regulator
MGFVGFAPTLSVDPRMDPRDFIWLTALGTAARAPAEIEDIRTSIDEIAGQLWTPVDEVVVTCLEEMLRSGALRLVATDRGLMETTERGRDTLSLLLTFPLGHPGCQQSRVGHRLKMAFIDLVPPADRRYHLGCAMRACECEIAECERRGQICSTQGAFGRLWLDHEAERLRRDLSQLETMVAQCGGTAAAGSQAHHV